MSVQDIVAGTPESGSTENVQLMERNGMCLTFGVVSHLLPCGTAFQGSSSFVPFVLNRHRSLENTFKRINIITQCYGTYMYIFE